MKELGIPCSNLQRFISRGYIEPPKRVGLGRGKGTASWYHPETLDRMDCIARSITVSHRQSYILLSLCEADASVAVVRLKETCCRLIERIGAVMTGAASRTQKKASGRPPTDSEKVLFSTAALLGGRDPGFEPDGYAESLTGAEMEDIDLRSVPFAKAAGLAPEDRTCEDVLPTGTILDGLSDLSDNNPFEIRQMLKTIRKCADVDFVARLKIGIAFSPLGATSGFLAEYVGAPKVRRKDPGSTDLLYVAALFAGLQCSMDMTLG